MLGKLRRGTEPAALLSRREQERLNSDAKQELRLAMPKHGGHYPVWLEERTCNEKLRAAALVKSAQKERRAPWTVAGATAVLGAGGWLTRLTAELVAGPMDPVIVTGGTAAVGGVAALALSVMGHRSRRWRCSEDACAVAAPILATLGAALGPAAWPWLGLTLLGGAAAEATSWRKHLTPAPQIVLPAAAEPPAIEEAPPRPLSRADEFANDWARVVSGELLV